ncbi:hypothetical protein HBB16_05135 [Pseudonocardia sp. MCCB 268]|nr:hypothetical protein [Pseudonocardia cytotoxica]
MHAHCRHLRRRDRQTQGYRAGRVRAVLGVGVAAQRPPVRRMPARPPRGLAVRFRQVAPRPAARWRWPAPPVFAIRCRRWYAGTARSWPPREQVSLQAALVVWRARRCSSLPRPRRGARGRPGRRGRGPRPPRLRLGVRLAVPGRGARCAPAAAGTALAAPWFLA